MSFPATKSGENIFYGAADVLGFSKTAGYSFCGLLDACLCYSGVNRLQNSPNRETSQSVRHPAVRLQHPFVTSLSPFVFSHVSVSRLSSKLHQSDCHVTLLSAHCVSSTTKNSILLPHAILFSHFLCCISYAILMLPVI